MHLLPAVSSTTVSVFCKQILHFFHILMLSILSHCSMYEVLLCHEEPARVFFVTTKYPVKALDLIEVNQECYVASRNSVLQLLMRNTEWAMTAEISTKCSPQHFSKCDGYLPKHDFPLLLEEYSVIAESSSQQRASRYFVRGRLPCQATYV